jgi:predicted permease
MRWLRPFLRRSAVEREMDAELRFHQERMAEDLVKEGLSPEEARRRVRIEFGGVEKIKDEAREARIAGYVERAWRGFRMAARNLAGSPGFTAVAIVTLTLGIGVNTLLFSLLDQLLLRNLPVPDPQRLVVFHGNFTTPGMYRANERLMSFSWPKYRDFRDRSEVFSGVAARFEIQGTLEFQGAAENVEVELVSGNYFDVLGARPLIGRVIGGEDNRGSMGHPLVVLGYAYWQRRFGGDPAIVGQKVHVNGMAMTVIGVSARGFHSIDRGKEVDLRIPMAMRDLLTPGWPRLGDRFSAWLNIVARVKPGVSLRQAEAAANVTYRQVLEEEAKSLPPTFTRRNEFLRDHLDLLPAAGGMMDRMGDQKAYFVELMAIAAVVLLIGCVNLAALVLARTAARGRELAIRLALGAGRMGVMRQLVAENAMLAIAGGSSGILLAIVLVRPAARFLISADAGELIDAPLDWRVLLFGLAVSIVTALIFALAPALQLNRTELADVLKSGSGSSSSRGQVRLRKGMVAVQLAFCVWLMIGAGLFARSLAQMKSVDLGFSKERLITFQFNPFQSGYKSDQGLAAYRRVTAALSALPGVDSVACSNYGVLTGNINMMNLDIEGYRPPPPDPFAREVRELVVTPGYFRTVNTKLVAGREFLPADLQPPLHTAIVNREFARQYFVGQNPIGRHFAWAGPNHPRFEIVGVVEDHHYYGPASAVKPFYYLPSEILNSYYVRTSLPAEALLSVVRRTVEQQAPGVPIDHLRTMEDFFNSTIGDKSRIATLASFFGLVATLLAAVGLYGVMAFTVARRTREIGVRMALGAGRANVLRMVLREAGVLIAAGLAVGLPTSIVLARLVRAQLFQVSPIDARATVAAAVLVSATCLVAGLVPAWRAMRIEPMRALRWE